MPARRRRDAARSAGRRPARGARRDGSPRRRPTPGGSTSSNAGPRHSARRLVEDADPGPDARATGHGRGEGAARSVRSRSRRPAPARTQSARGRSRRGRARCGVASSRPVPRPRCPFHPARRRRRADRARPGRARRSPTAGRASIAARTIGVTDVVDHHVGSAQHANVDSPRHVGAQLTGVSARCNSRVTTAP